MNKGILLPVLSLLLCVAVLLGLSFGLQGIAAEKAQSEHLRLLRTVLPGSENFTVEPYAGDDANIVSVHKGENGFVVETSTYGYAGNITMYIGVNNDGKVTGLVVNEMSETPGLGAVAAAKNAKGEAFRGQFVGQEGQLAVGEQIDAMSGATITSNAVVTGVNAALSYVANLG